jgi:hypothetical protein
MDRAGLSLNLNRRDAVSTIAMGFPQENRSANSREKSYRRLNENGCGKGAQGSPSQWEPHPYARRSGVLGPWLRFGVLGRWVSNYNTVLNPCGKTLNPASRRPCWPRESSERRCFGTRRLYSGKLVSRLSCPAQLRARSSSPCRIRKMMFRRYHLFQPS